MKMNFFLFALIILVITSCDTDEVSNLDISGEYSGTFERNGEFGNVQLDLIDDQFTGSSEKIKFPAICNGAYSISGKMVKFSNMCPWTAEFDWTLILAGDWKFQLTENNLVLTNSIGDKYSLTKQ